MRNRSGLTATLVALALALVASAGNASTGGPSSGASIQRHPALLRAVGQRLVDGKGREVILRGIAVINKSSPYLPPVGPTDFARIRSWGMNSIRLGVLWAGIEPQKGVYDNAYLDRAAALVDEATDAGLYVIVDMHQDLFGIPWGNGAPAWVGQTPCPHIDLASASGAWAANYLSPAIACAFTAFWTSSDLQQHYTTAWVKLASRLKHNPRVAGYDLMNEPSQGFIAPALFETAFLYPSQARWLAAIRRVDPNHIGFLECANFKNVHLPTVPDLTPPPNTVYAPHLYGFWDQVPGAAEQIRPPLAELNFRYSVGESKIMNVPLWLGEWGMVYDAPGAQDFARLVYDMVDSVRAGAAWWVYEPGTGYSPINASGTPRPILRDLARSYPSAVPGLQSFSFDADMSTLVALWSRRGNAVFMVPRVRYPSGVVVETDGKWSWDPDTAELRVSGGTSIRITPKA